jgi:hypothetical protein
MMAETSTTIVRVRKLQEGSALPAINPSSGLEKPNDGAPT